MSTPINDQIYDCIIVGCGPAGLSAALNLQIRKKSFMLFGSSICSPRLAKADQVDNYLGLPAISGSELRNKFVSHVQNFGITIRQKRVTAIYPMGDKFSATAGQEAFLSKSIILATGVHINNLLPGEEDYLGKGVSYCATCDGMLFRDKVLALIDYTETEGIKEATFLASIAKSLYYIVPKLTQKPTNLPHNLTYLNDKPIKIIGEDVLNSLVLQNQTIRVDGVFIIRETQRADLLVPGIQLSTKGSINVAQDCSTNLPGVFAAGDCSGKPYQLAKAVGQGSTAALSAVEYLDSL